MALVHPPSSDPSAVSPKTAAAAAALPDSLTASPSIHPPATAAIGADICDVEWLVTDDGDSFYSSSGAAEGVLPRSLSSTGRSSSHQEALAAKNNNTTNQSYPIRRTTSLSYDHHHQSMRSGAAVEGVSGVGSGVSEHHAYLQRSASKFQRRASTNAFYQQYSHTVPPLRGSTPRVCSIANSPNLADVPISAIVTALETELEAVDAGWSPSINANVISMILRTSSPQTAPPSELTAARRSSRSQTPTNDCTAELSRIQSSQSTRADSSNSYVARVPSPLELPSTATEDELSVDSPPSRFASGDTRRTSSSRSLMIDNHTPINDWQPADPPRRQPSAFSRRSSQPPIHPANSFSQFPTNYSPTVLAARPECAAEAASRHATPSSATFTPSQLYPISDHSDREVTPQSTPRRRLSATPNQSFYNVTDAVNQLLIGGTRKTNNETDDDSPSKSHSRDGSREWDDWQRMDEQMQLGYY